MDVLLREIMYFVPYSTSKYVVFYHPVAELVKSALFVDVCFSLLDE